MPCSRIVSRLALVFAAAATAAPSPLNPLSEWVVPPACAQVPPAFGSQGVIELVPPTGLVGDGATAAEMYVVALGPDGRPLSGLKTRPTVSAGVTTDMLEVGSGVYRFTYTPPKVDGAQQVTLSIKGKIANKEAYARTWMVSVQAPRSRQLALAANPAVLTLNQDRTASLAFNLAGGDRQSLAGVQLEVKSSSGSVENITHLGGGQFSALFNVPAVNYPHVALLTVVDKRDPTHTYGALPLALVGKAEYPVTVAPNSRVLIKVGGREFGPVQADSMGRAKVPIIVPPGATGATRVQVAPDGRVTEDALDLRIPEGKRIAMFPTAASIPADGRLQVPVRALVATPDGRPDENAQVVFSATGGVVSTARHEGGGVYLATFTPPFANAAAQVTIAVNLADKPALQADSLTVNLVPARAARVQLVAEPTTLPAGADGFKVYAKVAGPDGSGMGSRDVQFSASGARLKSEVKDLRNGDYQAMFATTGNGPVELSATVSAPNTGNPLARLFVVPARERMPADGQSSAMLTVASVDEFGYPVPNVAVTLKVSRGDGSVPATATTNEYGVAQVYYTAGRNNGFVAIEATAQEFSAGAALIQMPAELSLPDLPVSGSKATVAMADEWAASIASLRVEREGGMAGVAVAPPSAWGAPTGVAGRPARAQMISEPAMASPGGAVVLRVTVSDADGRGVGGQKLDFLTSAGSVTSVTDLGGGAYQAIFTVPTSAVGEVKISVANTDGSVSSFMRLPIGGADAAWGQNPFAPQAAADPFAPTTAPSVQPTTAATLAPPATTTTTVVKKSPPPSSDRPWLRIRGGYAINGYDYSQKPLTGATALFPSEITFETPVPAQGLAANAKVWVPTLRYLGGDVSLAYARYSLDPAPLCAKLGRPCADQGDIYDWVGGAHVLAAGRYPFTAGASEFSIGARAGWSMSDVQAYLKEQDAIKLQQLPIHSLAIGPEVNAEIGERLFLNTWFLEHLAGGSTPFNTQFGISAGYGFLDNMYASVGYDLSVRKVEIANTSGGPIGEISDQMQGGTLSVGFQY